MPPAEDGTATGAPMPALPGRFRAYAISSAGAGRNCLAGVITDEDGLRKRAVVALAHGQEGPVAWSRELDGLEDAYQARATHCLLGHGALYVLLQSDTHPARTRSQTLLSVAKLDIRGQVQATRTVSVPESFGQACSAWVDEQPAHFRWEGGRLVIEGYYRPISDVGSGKPFRISLGPELDP